VDKYDVVIVGGGPGGLRCSKLLAEAGASVLVLEKKSRTGDKVCAGGITWSGLIERIPQSLIERSFSSQYVTTRYQNIKISSDHPIIATINRLNLGSYMHEAALEAGADIINSATVTKIDNKSVQYLRGSVEKKCHFDYLVGADGSFSRVRRFLGVPTTKIGPGLTYTCPCTHESMEWHFDSEKFGSGYTWIFPHSNSASVGAYCYDSSFKVSTLKKYLIDWAENKNIDLKEQKLRAERINSDYRGFRFGHFFLVGDAAGLASPLTGEGIFPAFVSGEAAAHTIIDPEYDAGDLKRLTRKHYQHELVTRVASRHTLFSLFLSELAVFLLRCRLISFDKFEMA
jgi:geranylgeranyl reductase